MKLRHLLQTYYKLLIVNTTFTTKLQTLTKTFSYMSVIKQPTYLFVLVMQKVAAHSVGADGRQMVLATHLSLVARMTRHRAELALVVRKLTLVTVATRS